MKKLSKIYKLERNVWYKTKLYAEGSTLRELMDSAILVTDGEPPVNPWDTEDYEMIEEILVNAFRRELRFDMMP